MRAERKNKGVKRSGDGGENEDAGKKEKDNFRVTL